MPDCRWVGIDCGFSQMGIAVIDQSDRVLAVERTRQPLGDGHSREVALARLRELLIRIRHLRDVPVHLAGYCYDHTGVFEAFTEEGWSVQGGKALNDVVGVYGLTDMRGEVVVGGCGSFSQVVYVDGTNTIHWPGDDIADAMPSWLLSGWAYANLLVDLSSRNDVRLETLAREVQEHLGGDTLTRSDGRWGNLGPLLSSVIDLPEVRQFLSDAAENVVKIRDLFWSNTTLDRAPDVVLGGGAVRDQRLWSVLERELSSRGVSVKRVEGEPAVGLARFAKCNPEADAWSYVGRIKPSWLR